ncbi:hypothetical protein BJX76DRAFT_365960 [Aspergillus varians]
MKNFLLTSALLASSAYGHIQMSQPYPIRSPLNQQASGEKDYSYTNPLSTSGSDFPCKGYANDAFNSVATYSPGGEYEIKLEGSATHGGGSCQISLSYDKGESFQVIHSILGGCPITKSYEFTIPSDAPSGEALLAWSWFNKIGNREMYMNCAQVTIGGDQRLEGFTAVSETNAFDNLPSLFIANVNGPGQCTTIEGEEVNFPQPGSSVEGSLSGEGYKCSGSAPFLGTSNAPNKPRPKPKPSASTSTSVARPPVTSSAAAVPSSASSTALTVSKALLSTVAESTATLRPQVPVSNSKGAPCVAGAIICSEDGSSWSICDYGSPVHMGNVAPGTRCKNGAIVRLD